MSPEPGRIGKPFYRADVDGLRAVAVLAVVGYHYWGHYIPGGFIGVDIFFVISGYLLSALIISDVQDGRFTFSGFYERRIRRIFPALFVLLGVATAAACFFLWPSDLISYSRSMLAASLSSSNFYFWATSNYFAGNGEEKPLLHTWSLAVEEQFYILFPIFIVLIHRYLPRYLRTVVTMVTIASLAWSIVDVRLDRSAAFYLPFTRAWELLFGAMLTLRMIPFPNGKLWRECLAELGFLGIAISIFGLSADTLFPGECSILPCVAAGMIIIAGQDESTLTRRVLSWKPVVFIGLISYSLYLWHWPLLVFFDSPVFFPKHVSGLHSILALASVLIATISWRFVEAPFRTGPRKPDKQTVFVFGAGCVVTFATVALVLSSLGGLRARFPSALDAVGDYISYKDTFPSEYDELFRRGCFLEIRVPVSHFDESRCLGPVGKKSQVLLLGDSLAADLKYGLDSAYPSVHFLQTTSANCRPVLGQGDSSECTEFLSRVFKDYIPSRSISLVAMSAFWSPKDLPALTKTIDFLRQKGVAVVVFGPRPQYSMALPRLLAESAVLGDVKLPRQYLVAYSAPLDATMQRLAKDTWHVPYISLLKLLCPHNQCRVFAAPGVPLQFDDHHLTLQGSTYVGRELNAHFPDVFELD